MSQPTKSQIHVDKPLLNMSIAYKQDQKAFVADLAAPVVEVEKQSDLYFVFDKRTFMTSGVQLVGDGEETHGVGYNLSTEAYYCKNYGLHKDIGDQSRANTDSPLDQDRTAVEVLTHNLLIEKEKQWAATVFIPGAWTTAVTGASNTFWNDGVNSDPLSVIEAQKIVVLKRTGRKPNVLVVGADVLAALKNHPLIVDRVKYTSSSLLDESEIARLLGLEKVLTPYAVIDSAAEGKAGSIDFVASAKDALLMYVPAKASIETPSAALTFAWKGLHGERSLGMRVKKMRIETRDADRIRADCAFAHKVTGADLGVFFDSIVE